MDDLTNLEEAFKKLGKGDPRLIKAWITPQTIYKSQSIRGIRGSKDILAVLGSLRKVIIFKANARRMDRRELRRGESGKGFVVVLNTGRKNPAIVFDLWFNDSGKLKLIQSTDVPV